MHCLVKSLGAEMVVAVSSHQIDLPKTHGRLGRERLCPYTLLITNVLVLLLGQFCARNYSTVLPGLVYYRLL